jgi:hypothetical protein
MAFEWHPPQLDPETGFLIVCGVASRSGVQPYTNDSNEVRGVYRSGDFIKGQVAVLEKGRTGLVFEHETFNPQNLSHGMGWVSDAQYEQIEGEGFALFEAVVTEPNAIDEIKKQGDSLAIPVSPAYTFRLLKPSKPEQWKDSLGLVGDKGETYDWIEEQVGDPQLNHLACVSMGRGGNVVGIFANNPLDSLKSSGIYDSKSDSPPVVGDELDENSADSSYLYDYPHTEDSEENMKEVLDALASMAEENKKNNDSVKSMCDAMTTMADSLSKFGNMSDALDRMESQISGLAGAIKESRESSYEVSAEEQAAKIAAEGAKDGVVDIVEEKAAPAQDSLSLALDKMTALVEKLATRPEVTADGYVPTYVGIAKKSPVTKNAGGGFDITL